MTEDRKYIHVNNQLYKLVDEPFDGDTCPFCGSSNLTTHAADEIFLQRTGCLDCDTWIDPVRLRLEKT